jgi:RNA polymerase sigma-70 factor (ECF subfamily)
MSNKPDIQSPAAVDEDHEFVSACRKGNVDAFEVLVEKYQKKMLNIAYRMTGDYEEACEIVQEAFLSAYRAIRKFRGEARFATWLYGITVNHAKNRMRQVQSRSRHETLSLDDPVETENGWLVHDPPSAETPIVEQLEKKEIQSKVQECISSLDDEYREVLVLRDIQGFSYEEIRDILKIPDGTVKSRLFRARDALKDCLKKVIKDL